jgi:phosphate transport system substrate-binding protein
MAISFCHRVALVGLSLLLASCGTSQLQQSKQRQPITIDGSSTVFPMTEAIAAAYEQTAENPVELNVSFSGTGGGFKKFCSGETDVSNASRPILEAELQACDQNDVRFVELPIAMDALAIVVNAQNTWAEDITVAELRRLWEPGAQRQVTTWQQIRPSWPEEPIVLYGPGTDSGTYDYFAEVIVGDGQETRSDYIASEDDELLAKGVASQPNTLGYFGLAYLDEHQNQLKALSVDSGSGAVQPAVETVGRGGYNPLGRPLFMYVNLKHAQQNKALREFVTFALENAASAAETVGYIPLTDEAYHIDLVNFQEGDAGTAFDGKPQPSVTIAELLRKVKRVE